MSRKKFIESHGATCSNWNWSWSFVNHPKKFIIFGAWDVFADSGRGDMIFDDAWKTNYKGKKPPGYQQSREHIRLIEEEGYELFTFPMKYSEARKDGDGEGPGKIAGFEPTLHKKSLLRSGDKWYATDTETDLTLAEEIPEKATYNEGAKKQITVNAIERNGKARKACIAHYGAICAVCELDFGQVYGELGEGFIHVHHRVPISEVGEEYTVDPIKDLIPVCPNCHAMIHRVNPPKEIDELRQIYLNAKAALA